MNYYRDGLGLEIEAKPKVYKTKLINNGMDIRFGKCLIDENRF